MAKQPARQAEKNTAPKTGASKSQTQKKTATTAKPKKAASQEQPKKKEAPKGRPPVDVNPPGADVGRTDLLRRQLIKSREEIVSEAKTEIGKYIKGETRQLVESVLDDGDWSVIDLAEDINLKRLAAHREVLLKIDEALRKLKEGTYGSCEDCGEPINTARLKVLPFAIYCRDCQEKREDLEKVEQEEM